MDQNVEIPIHANNHCPGPESESAGKSQNCEGCPNQQACSTAPKGIDPRTGLQMAKVKHKILVLSGKGGVGKSTFSAQLALTLAATGLEVGLLDIDICGPSIPKMLGLEGNIFHQSNLGYSPIYVQPNLGAASISFFLEDPEDPAILRGPRKTGLIQLFLREVYWDELDFLIVDTPPGTSDEQISIVQSLTGIDGAVIVTTPQEVSLADVRKGIKFCERVNVEILGVVENMSGFSRPMIDSKFFRVTATGEEREVTDWVKDYVREKAPELMDVVAFDEVFDSSKGGALRMCSEIGVPFLGKVPLDPSLCKAAEEGRLCSNGVSRPALIRIINKLMENPKFSKYNFIN